MPIDLRERRNDGTRSPSEWEPILTTWSTGPSDTEEEKCERAELAVRKAIASHPKLAALDITVFAQGSYRARTNVRQDSDVDVCVRLNSTFFTTYPPGMTDQSFGNVAGSITFEEYKSLIHEALKDRFGADSVTRGKKAFDVHANTYRIDADVVPTFTHRYYFKDGTYISGAAFIVDGGGRVENWPEQALAKGVAKHDATGRRYKKMVRILKRMRNAMQENRIGAAENIASFLIESLVWNVPNDRFGNDSYYEDLRNVITWAYNATETDESCKELTEVNDIKFLFHVKQAWTREQAHSFLLACWRYVGYK